MGLFDSIREVLGIAPNRATDAASGRTPLKGGEPSALSSPDSRMGHFLPQDQQANLLQLGRDGLPPLHLVHQNGALWLAEDTTGLLINVDNRHLRRLGVWGAKLRGVGYYDGESRLGAVLVREPGNPHDRNAVAVHVGGKKLGYYNKGMAAGLAKLLDTGETLSSECISTDPAKVISARANVLRHLQRRL